jgi:hypothetical protein
MGVRQPDPDRPVERSRLGLLAAIMLLGVLAGGSHAQCSFMSGDDNRQDDKNNGNTGGSSGAGGMG